MARGVKNPGKDNKTIEEKVADIIAEIEAHKNAIKDLKDKKKKLLVDAQKEDLEQVKKIAVESGLSADELRELIEKSKDAN